MESAANAEILAGAVLPHAEGDARAVVTEGGAAPEWLRELGWAEVYEVRGLMARGGMGRVYEGWHRALGMRVALKVMDPALVGDEQARARFEKEALTLARLQEPVAHPNIVRVLDFKLLDQVGCIVMAFVQGRNLKTWCRERRLGVHEKAALVAKVARAAGYLHSCGVVHRDLKPGNILVRDDDGEPVIVDFGIVRGKGDVTVTRTQQAVGTAGYMPPEALRGAGASVGSRADVFALGAILFELVTGQTPYGDTLTEVVRKQQEVCPPRPSTLVRDVPRDLEKVCMKAIAQRESERYATGTDLAEDLERYLAGEPVLARPAGVVVRVWRRVLRKPALAAAVVGLVFALGLSGWASYKDAREIKLAGLRQEISEGLAVEGVAPERWQAVWERVESLRQAGGPETFRYEQQLVQLATGQVQAQIKVPRVTDEVRTEIESGLVWLRERDPETAERLGVLLRERLRQWRVRFDLKPPFENLAEVLGANTARPDAEGKKLLAVEGRAIRIRPEFSAPVGVEVDFISDGQPGWLGVRAGTPERGYEFRLYQPLDSRMREQLGLLDAQLKDGTMPKAALAISSGGQILAVERLPREVPVDSPICLRVRLERDRYAFQVNDSHPLAYVPQNLTLSRWSWAVESMKKAAVSGMRVSRSDAPEVSSPLEEADQLASENRLVQAEEKYVQLAADPDYGAEALWKAGDCQWRRSDFERAMETWCLVMRMPASEWRELACLGLWRAHVSRGQIAEAAEYLHQLPARQPLPSHLLQSMSRAYREGLADNYRLTKRGLDLLRPVPRLLDAVKVYRMLNLPDLWLAAHLGAALHFEDLDSYAVSYLDNGFSKTDPEYLLDGENLGPNTCLELWSLIRGPESSAEFLACQSRFKELAPDGHSLRETIKLEEARCLARKGNAAAAGKMAEEVLSGDNSTIMAFTGAALLLRAVGQDAEGKQCRLALERVAAAKPQVHEFTICNRLLLQAAAGNATPGDIVALLGEFVCLDMAARPRDFHRASFKSFLLGDPAMAEACNSLLSEVQGRELLRAWALRERPVRDLLPKLVWLLLRRHAAISLFGEDFTPSEMRDCGVFTSVWLRVFKEGRLSLDDFLALPASWKNVRQNGEGALPAGLHAGMHAAAAGLAARAVVDRAAVGR